MPDVKPRTLPDGTKRYWFRVDTGRRPDGKRIQEYHSYKTRAEARRELARIMTEASQGTYIRQSDETLGEHLDGWLEGATRDLRASTRRNYVDAFLPVRERLGNRRTQSVTKADIEGLVTWMLASGRRRGGKAGGELSARSVRLTLGRLTAALESAVEEGKIIRNPARYVKPPKHVPRKRQTWTAPEVRRFLAVAAEDRLHAAWRLSVYGERRGEILGERWDDIDFDASTITIGRARVLVGYEVRIEEPKSANGYRTLPLDDETMAALTALRKLQRRERLAAGPAYQDSGYVVVDELGAPVHPEWFTDEFRRVASRAGVPLIRLHEGRHTTCSLMEKAGVPVSVIAAWAGHYSGAFTMATYVHANPDDLAIGRDALASIYGSQGAS